MLTKRHQFGAGDTDAQNVAETTTVATYSATDADGTASLTYLSLQEWMLGRLIRFVLNIGALTSPMLLIMKIQMWCRQHL